MLCTQCAAGDHSNHKPHLGGICIGCPCPTVVRDSTPEELAIDAQSEVKEVLGWQWKCNLCSTTGIELEQSAAEDVLEEHMEYHS